MPINKRSHGESRTLVCFCCLNKDKKCIDLSSKPALVNLIKEYVDPSFSLKINSNPNGLCNTCKTRLYQKKVISCNNHHNSILW